MIHLMSQNVDPTLSPTVNFNTLFETGKWYEAIKMSPVTQGYFQDVVVPLDSPKTLHEELITRDVRIATRQMKKDFIDNEDKAPKNNIFSEVKPDVEVNPEKIKTTLEIEGDAPWGEEDFAPAVSAVGAEPICVLEPTNINELEGDAALQDAMKKGIEYYIESKTPMYSSTVALRGGTPGGSFPGYVYAVPNVDQAVNLAKSPSEVFQRAWQMCHPNCFKGDSIVVNN
ncbi:unnamed protein product [Brassicogethes aeneus]|uniref:Uncharacterized protein n=1 Tax=Brassicogethes aeneus TaxID=1431903 RepID=A0A9P0FIW3_BRAAE|nr:unnamed protein product [Brassicogethes aeneus]